MTTFFWPGQIFEHLGKSFSVVGCICAPVRKLMWVLVQHSLTSPCAS